jgi:hypothetical protein
MMLHMMRSVGLRCRRASFLLIDPFVYVLNSLAQLIARVAR